MSQNTVSIEEGKGKIIIKLQAEFSPALGQSILIVLFLISVISIFLFLFIIVTRVDNIQFSWLVGFFLMSLVAWYFLRLLLWNSGGKEVLIITNNTLTHYSDYKLFNLGKNIYSFKELSVIYTIIDEETENEDTNTILDNFSKDAQRAILGFELDNETIVRTTVNIPFSEIRNIVKILENENKSS